MTGDSFQKCVWNRESVWVTVYIHKNKAGTEHITNLSVKVLVIVAGVVVLLQDVTLQSEQEQEILFRSLCFLICGYLHLKTYIQFLFSRTKHHFWHHWVKKTTSYHQSDLCFIMLDWGISSLNWARSWLPSVVLGSISDVLRRHLKLSIWTLI